VPLDSITFSGVMQFINAVGVLAVGVYTWLISRSVANREAIDKLVARQAESDRRIDHLDSVSEHVPTQRDLAETERRIERLESIFDHAPTHQDLSQLHGRINDLSEAVSRLVGVMSAVQRSLDRVETKLMQEAK